MNKSLKYVQSKLIQKNSKKAVKEMIQRNLRRIQCGSAAVEAALLLGFAITCLLFCIYGCFYLHDKAILEEASYITAQRGYVWMTENQDIWSGEADWERYKEKNLLWRLLQKKENTVLQKYMQDILEGKLFVCKMPHIDIEMKTDEITIAYCADTTLKGFYPVGNLFVIPQISGQVTRNGFESEEFIRLVKALKEERKEQ